MTEFFEQLSEFSVRVFDRLNIEETMSPWNSGIYTRSRPRGAILHWTGGNDPFRAVRWFMQKRRKARASAHFIVANEWGDESRRIAEEFPLVAELPTMVIQCVPPTHVAWHAKGVNRGTYGIEVVNVGRVKKDPDLGWVYWPKNWMTPWRMDKDPIRLNGRHYEPYSPGQIITVIELLRYLLAYNENPMAKSWVVGHENTWPGKPDPGPAFPLYEVRNSMFDVMDVPEMTWFQTFTENPRAVEFHREDIMSYTVGPYDDQGREFFKMVRGDPESHVKAVLGVLGYHTSNLSFNDLEDEDRESVKIFQRMMSLQEDGIAGPITQRALIQRLANRRYCK